MHQILQRKIRLCQISKIIKSINIYRPNCRPISYSSAHLCSNSKRFGSLGNYYEYNYGNSGETRAINVPVSDSRKPQLKIPDVVPSYKDIEIPIGYQRLRFLDKTPPLRAGLKMQKMIKRLDLIRGEEEVHTDFHYGQYGIVALEGGFLKTGHIEMIRRAIFNYLDTRRMFAIWRIDSPWKAHTKKGIGKRMGGGKGNISFYTSPVKAKRVLIEVGGKCRFEEVERFLTIIADRLPIKAIATSQELITKMREEDKKREEQNQNPFTMKYLFQNEMYGSKLWARSYDLKYFGKYR